MRFARRSIGTASGSYRRNIATSKVQDMLCAIGKGKDIGVPHVITTVSAAEMNGIPCIAMEALKGETVGRCARKREISYNNEFICRETWIQIQDVLTGQIDRHGYNVILTEKGPVAIDHDLSFPTEPPRDFAGTVPSSLVDTFKMPNGSLKELAIDGISPRNFCMPPVIDREMYDVIMAIDLPALEAMYEECGLTRREIGAAMARARGLQTAAQQLQNQGLVIEPDEWESSPLVQAYCNEQNFYALRHFAGG